MRLRSVFKKLGISLGSLLVLGLVAEVVARAAEPGPFSLWDERPYLHHPTLDHVHEPGFEGRWDGTWYAINELGLRGPEVEPKADGELRVVTLGDSCTFGKGVVEGDTWPRQLEGLLRAAAPPGMTPLVANLGVNGYSGVNYRDIFFEKGLELAPDLVVVGYNLNDFPNSLRKVDQAVYKQRGLRQLMPSGLRDAAARSALYRWLRAAYYDANRARDWERAERFAQQAAESGGDPEVWAEQENYLREIRDAAHGIGAEVAVFLFPYESQVYLDTYDTTPIRLLSELCGRLDLPFVSLEQEFRAAAHAEDPPRELFLRGDRYHPRPVGYAIVAERVLRLLQDEGWFPDTGSPPD